MRLNKLICIFSFLVIYGQAYAEPVYLQCTYKNSDDETEVAKITLDETTNKSTISTGSYIFTVDALFTAGEVSFEDIIIYSANVYFSQKYTIDRQDLSVTYDWTMIPKNRKMAKYGEKGSSKGECVIKEVKERKF